MNKLINTNKYKNEPKNVKKLAHQYMDFTLHRVYVTIFKKIFIYIYIFKNGYLRRKKWWASHENIWESQNLTIKATLKVCSKSTIKTEQSFWCLIFISICNFSCNIWKINIMIMAQVVLYLSQSRIYKHIFGTGNMIICVNKNYQETDGVV